MPPKKRKSHQKAVEVESVEKKKTMKKRGHGAPIIQVTTTADTSIQAKTSHVTQATWTPGHTAPPASQPPLSESGHGSVTLSRPLACIQPFLLCHQTVSVLWLAFNLFFCVIKR